MRFGHAPLALYTRVLCLFYAYSTFLSLCSDENSLSSSCLFPFLLLSLAVSDMRRGRGVWSGRTVCCQTVPRACSRPPWGPVSAAVPRAWRRGQGGPVTVALQSPTGLPCSTETPLTRSATLRIATGVQVRSPLCSSATYDAYDQTLWNVTESSSSGRRTYTADENVNRLLEAP